MYVRLCPSIFVWLSHWLAGSLKVRTTFNLWITLRYHRGDFWIWGEAGLHTVKGLLWHFRFNIYMPANTENSSHYHGTSIILHHWLPSYYVSHQPPSVVYFRRFLSTTSGRTQKVGECSLSIIQPQENRCVKFKKQTRYVLRKRFPVK